MIDIFSFQGARAEIAVSTKKKKSHGRKIDASEDGLQTLRTLPWVLSSGCQATWRYEFPPCSPCGDGHFRPARTSKRQSVERKRTEPQTPLTRQYTCRIWRLSHHSLFQDRPCQRRPFHQ